MLYKIKYGITWFHILDDIIMSLIHSFCLGFFNAVVLHWCFSKKNYIH